VESVEENWFESITLDQWTSIIRSDMDGFYQYFDDLVEILGSACARDATPKSFIEAIRLLATEALDLSQIELEDAIRSILLKATRALMLDMTSFALLLQQTGPFFPSVAVANYLARSLAAVGRFYAIPLLVLYGYSLDYVFPDDKSTILHHLFSDKSGLRLPLKTFSAVQQVPPWSEHLGDVTYEHMCKRDKRGRLVTERWVQTLGEQSQLANYLLAWADHLKQKEIDPAEIK